jgi:DNA-binding transcriptional regulator YhcF (GntR family)
MATKKNFMKRSKNNFKKGGEFQTVFHLGISSKAVFTLSEQALKLYILFVLHGKRNPPSMKLFAARMKKSERTVSRLYEELKEKKFLTIECIRPKVYKYVFDSNGNVDYKPKEDKKEFELIEKPIEELDNEEVEIIEDIENIDEDEDEDIFEKARTIMEYEDFAVLENIFWELAPKSREKIVSILEERFKKEPQSKEVLEWFLEKVKYV